LDEAISAYRRALELRSDVAEIHNNLANALNAAGQTDQAIDEFERAIALKPELAEALENLGELLSAKGARREAAAAFRRAAAHRPGDPAVLWRLGNALLACERFIEAADVFRELVKLQPDNDSAFHALGVTLHSLGEFDGAAGAYRRAIELRPDFASAHWNLGLLLLLLGDFAQGWQQYQWGRKVSEFQPTISNYSQPVWEGGDLDGRRILLHFEQAFGDTIHFVRYVPAVAQRGGKVMLLCQPQMHRLLRGMPGVEQCVTPQQALGVFDVHCPLPSLPLVLGLPQPQDLPWRGPYLKSDPALKAKFADVLEAGGTDVKIGLVWSGQPYPPGRSVPLSALSPLARPGVRFYSLQIGQGSEQARQAPAAMRLIDATDRIEDFADTAALMEQLDLIVSIDTAAAQLAGALGKPGWVLLKQVPDWRWLLGREDSPWYPTLRLFRQERAGEWEQPIHRMADALATMLEARKA
jgi:Flp pilus assembly protein TadD